MKKMGLVQIEGEAQTDVDQGLKADLEEIDRQLAAEEKKPKARRGAPAPAPAPTPAKQPAPRHAPPPAAVAGDIAEGKPFDAYYAEAAVEPSPYPAEKLIKVLDGLRQLDAHTRSAAVTAMDAADETWSIADVVLDAQRKQRVLEDAKVMLGHQAQAVREECQQKREQLEQYRAEAEKTIREKIRQLEEQLGKAIGEVMAEQTKLDSRAQQAQDAATREAARLQTEIQRLSEITQTFIVERPTGG